METHRSSQHSSGLSMVVLLAVLGGCSLFSSETPGYCVGQPTACPAGQACSARTGLCEPGDGGAVDMPQASPSDAAQHQTTACSAGVGTQVGKPGQDAWACAGKFQSQAEQGKLCGPGYTVCTAGTNVDDSACHRAGGFFLVDAPISVSLHGGSAYTFNCGDESGQIKALLGCGASVKLALTSACQGLMGQIECQGPLYNISGWSCATGYEDATNANSGDGVLCCGL